MWSFSSFTFHCFYISINHKASILIGCKAWLEHFVPVWSHQDPCVSPHGASSILNIYTTLQDVVCWVTWAPRVQKFCPWFWCQGRVEYIVESGPIQCNDMYKGGIAPHPTHTSHRSWSLLKLETITINWLWCSNSALFILPSYDVSHFSVNHRVLLFILHNLQESLRLLLI